MREKVTLHGLWEGLPLCGFSRELPVFWPVGHNWVDVRDGLDRVNCPACRERAKLLFSAPGPSPGFLARVRQAISQVRL